MAHLVVALQDSIVLDKMAEDRSGQHTEENQVSLKGARLNLHHDGVDGLHPLEGEAHLHEDSQPTQEVICGFTLNTIESARIFQYLVQLVVGRKLGGQERQLSKVQLGNLFR